MRAGEMDRLVIIETPTEGVDDYGGATLTWATFVEVWASKRPARAGEGLSAERIAAQDENVWRLHWIDGITYKMRINEDGTYHDIVGKIEIGRREGIELTTRLHQAT